jgi:hypothetical protein
MGMFINNYILFWARIFAIFSLPTWAQSLEEKTSVLPTASELLDLKLNAVNKSLSELDSLLINSQKDLAKEQGLENKVFDKRAYFSLSIVNKAPESKYRLESTEIYIDDAKKPLAQGGPHNQGMPRKNELFFGAITPGCHELLVKAKFVRITNDLVGKLAVNRVEKITAIQAFNAAPGYLINIEIEGYETENTFASFDKSPGIRFINKAEPNFLPGKPLISLDDVLKQGRLQINYITEDLSNHKLASKSVSIDGRPILTDEKYDQKDGAIIFDAPITPGEHNLNTTLVFTEKKWITGGPSYNFRLSFAQKFYVELGQTTVINLAGMPKGGIKSALDETRYAKSSTQIVAKDFKEFFFDRCKNAPKSKPPKVEEKKEDKKPEPQPEPIKAIEPTTGAGE